LTVGLQQQYNIAGNHFIGRSHLQTAHSLVHEQGKVKQGAAYLRDLVLNEKFRIGGNESELTVEAYGRLAEALWLLLGDFRRASQHTYKRLSAWALASSWRFMVGFTTDIRENSSPIQKPKTLANTTTSPLALHHNARIHLALGQEEQGAALLHLVEKKFVIRPAFQCGHLVGDSDITSPWKEFDTDVHRRAVGPFQLQIPVEYATNLTEENFQMKFHRRRHHLTNEAGKPVLVKGETGVWPAHHATKSAASRRWEWDKLVATFSR
jgi:hypothetical protein